MQGMSYILSRENIFPIFYALYYTCTIFRENITYCSILIPPFRKVKFWKLNANSFRLYSMHSSVTFPCPAPGTLEAVSRGVDGGVWKQAERRGKGQHAQNVKRGKGRRQGWGREGKRTASETGQRWGGAKGSVTGHGVEHKGGRVARGDESRRVRVSSLTQLPGEGGRRKNLKQSEVRGLVSPVSTSWMVIQAGALGSDSLPVILGCSLLSLLARASLSHHSAPMPLKASPATSDTATPPIPPHVHCPTTSFSLQTPTTSPLSCGVTHMAVCCPACPHHIPGGRGIQHEGPLQWWVL